MASRSRSGSRSLKSTSSKAMKFFSGNSLLTNLAIFITIAVSISYLAKQHFYALIMLYGVAAIIFLISKNILMSLALAIILTNLFAPPPVKRVKFFREGMEHMEDIIKEKKEKVIDDLKAIRDNVHDDDNLTPSKKDQIKNLIGSRAGPSESIIKKLDMSLKDKDNSDYEAYPKSQLISDLNTLKDTNGLAAAAKATVNNIINEINTQNQENSNSPSSNQQGFTESMSAAEAQEAPLNRKKNN